LERLVKEKHSSLLGPFKSYEEDEVLWMTNLFLNWHMASQEQANILNARLGFNYF